MTFTNLLIAAMMLKVFFLTIWQDSAQWCLVQIEKKVYLAMHITLQDRLDESKKKSSTERLSLFMGKFTVGVPLLQFLVQCSFSYPLMIYRAVSIVGPHPHLFNGEWGLQREGLRFPIKMEGWGKVGEFSLSGEMLDFLLSWEQSWYSYILTITWNWLVES